MIRPEDQRRRDQLRDLLFELAKSQQILEKPKDRANYFRKLESIYYSSDNIRFRHFYSEIFSTLSFIDRDPCMGDINVLGQNIQSIIDGYAPKNKDKNGNLIDITEELLKLYDHVNLEISRINYNHDITDSTKSKLAETEKLVEDLNKKLQENDSRMCKNEENAQKTEKNMRAMTMNNIRSVTELSSEIKTSQKEMQTNYISILGIFASIVLSFTAGLAFSSSVFENIGNASSYRILLVSLIIGIVFYNIIWLLIDFIRDICKKDNPKYIRNTKIPRNWLWLFIVNIIFIVGIFLTCFAYKYDWFEKDSKADPMQEPTVAQEETFIETTSSTTITTSVDDIVSTEE